VASAAEADRTSIGALYSLERDLKRALIRVRAESPVVASAAE